MRQAKKIARLSVREYLLAEADRMIRANGFEACTLSRLSDRIGMRISSIQAYFSTREELGNAVVETYVSKLAAALDAIEKRQIPTAAKLSAFRRHFSDLGERKMPLQNAMGSRKSRKHRFLARQQLDPFSVRLAWLERIIENGKAAGDFNPNIDTRTEALRLLSVQRDPSTDADYHQSAHHRVALRAPSGPSE